MWTGKHQEDANGEKKIGGCVLKNLGAFFLQVMWLKCLGKSKLQGKLYRIFVSPIVWGDRVWHSCPSIALTYTIHK